MPWDIEALTSAWRLASFYHKGQEYGGPEEGQFFEYLTHIGSVTFEVLCALQHEPEVDANLALQCAILHDTLEDTAFAPESLRDTFGDAVLAGVLALTKNKSLPNKQAQMEDSLDRILVQPREVAMVKLADRITNMSKPPHYWTDAKKRAYQEEAQLIVDRLGAACSFLAHRLKEKIEDYGSYIEGSFFS